MKIGVIIIGKSPPKSPPNHPKLIPKSSHNHPKIIPDFFMCKDRTFSSLREENLGSVFFLIVVYVFGDVVADFADFSSKNS